MIDTILHFLGICPDSMAHPNLLNLFGLGAMVSGVGILIKHKLKTILNNIRSKK
jgi:hypothetical protein